MREPAGEQGSIHWQIPMEHPCYADHFPTQALVPGALLLHWLQLRLAPAIAPSQLMGIRQAKFMAPCFPGDQVSLLWQRKRSGVHATLVSQERKLLDSHWLLKD